MSPLGGFRETGSLLLFSPEGRTYSPPRRHKLHILRPAASGRSHSFRCASFSHKVNDFVGALLRRWYLPLASRALCEADAASAEASRQCHSTRGAAVIVCADGKTQPQTCLCGGLRFVTHLPPACSKLSQEQSFGYVQAALPQIGRRLRRHPFLFAKKKQKARAQNDGVTVRYPIFERGRKGCEFNAHPCSLASV